MDIQPQLEKTIKEHEYKSIKECRSRCVCNKPRPVYKKKEFLDVIMSFEKDSQIHFEIKVPHKLSEEEFIGFLIGILDKKNLLDLTKISLCLYHCEGVHCYDYILQTGGKYYFNVDLNDDPHTHKWNNFRNKLVETSDIPSKTSTNAVIKHKKRSVNSLFSSFIFSISVLSLLYSVMLMYDVSINY